MACTIALNEPDLFGLVFGMNINRHIVQQRAFTLVELMGAVLISLIVILMLYQIFDRVQSVFVVSQNRARAMEQGRVAMDMVVTDLQALAAPSLNDGFGEVANIEWVDDGNTGESIRKTGYLSPVRPFYITAIDAATGILQVENLISPAVGDTLYFPDNATPNKVGRVTAAVENKFTYETDPDGDGQFVNPFINYKGQPGVHEPNPSEQRAEVHMEAIPHHRWRFYQATAQDLYRHHVRFFTNDEGWRFVDYKFGGRANYKTMDIDSTNPSPVGALWVYRSRIGARSTLLDERVDHQTLMGYDPSGRELKEPVGYARVMDGVLHFRVRAVNPNDPGRALSSPKQSFFTGTLKPSHVEVELAVLDPKLVDEMEAGIQQRMEGEAPGAIYHAKLRHLAQNMDRVYFYKQIVPIKGDAR